MSYGFDEDLEVYDYGQDNLGDLLDEGMNDLNDVTFGDELGSNDDFSAFGAPAPPVGRDFDFAGSTSRFLDSSAAPPPPPGHHQLRQEPPQQQQQKPSPSPWNALNADPLLSRTPISLPPPPPPPQQQQQQASAAARTHRTVDEIEAEMRAQRLSSQPSSAQGSAPLMQQQQQGPPGLGGVAPTGGAGGPGRPLTLEEVEADMLRRRNAGVGSVPPPPPPHGQQGYYPGQQHPPPTSSQSPFQGQPFGGPLPPSGYPHAGASPLPPPGMLPPPPGMMGPGLRNPLAPIQPGGGIPPPPPLPLGTLFPPLPSQQPGAPPTTATVEQQLQYLTSNQHAQHPSLTSAQLHLLLQQAHLPSVSGVGAPNSDPTSLAAGEALIRSVEERIKAHEALELARKRKALKIAGMAKHNGLMRVSDKDFIMRIQVSQLVTDDPYADDFYFHVMAAIRAARNGPLPPPGGAGGMRGPMEGPGGIGGGPGGPGGSGGGAGGGNNNNNRRPTRRENAMNRMAQNVQRLVDSAKQRNNKGQLSLDGALGKIALRTRSAPRQMLQVVPGQTPTTPASKTAGHALLAGLISAKASTTKSSATTTTTTTTPGAGAGAGAGTALSYRAVLLIVEEIYDQVLELEQMRRGQGQLIGAAQAARDHGAPEEVIERAEGAVKEWDEKYAELSAKLWVSLRVMEPLDSSTPHPFISLMSVTKGKRILPRALRHLSQEQTLTLVTLILATFDTLDTVVDAPLLDAGGSAASIDAKQKRAAVETKTEAFLHAIISPIMAVIGGAPLRMVTGMLGLLLERNDLQKVARSKPGIAFLTILLSRAESLNQATPPPDPTDLQQWQQVFTQLFNALSIDLPGLFPSTRATASLPFGVGYYLVANDTADADLEDEPVWRFLAALAVCADPQEQQNLVVAVREKVLECVRGANKGKIPPEVAALKIRNCNLLLHSLGLDSSQLTVE